MTLNGFRYIWCECMTMSTVCTMSERVVRNKLCGFNDNSKILSILRSILMTNYYRYNGKNLRWGRLRSQDIIRLYWAGDDNPRWYAWVIKRRCPTIVRVFFLPPQIIHISTRIRRLRVSIFSLIRAPSCPPPSESPGHRYVERLIYSRIHVFMQMISSKLQIPFSSSPACVPLRARLVRP